MTPLKKVRIKNEETLQDVAKVVGVDTGNLSRIERGLQVPSKDLAAKLASHFNHEVTEMHILFPERFSHHELVEDVSTVSNS